MRAIMRFFKSPMGKFLLVAIAVALVIYIVMKQQEKKIYSQSGYLQIQHIL